MRALVLSGGGTERETEELDALAAFCPGADVERDGPRHPGRAGAGALGPHQGPPERLSPVLRSGMWCSARSATTLIRIIGCSPNCCRPSFAITDPRLRDPQVGSRHSAPDASSTRWTPMSPRRRRGCCSSTTRRRSATTGSTSRRFSACPDCAACSAAARTRRPSFWRRRSRFRRSRRQRLKGHDMRVLVTGHQGYLGTVMVPILQAAGHDVTGLDSGFFADCVLGPAPDDPPGDPRSTCGTSTVEQLSGFDAVIHLAALSNDPLGALAPADHLRHQPPRVGAAGAAGEGGGGPAVPLRLDMFGVRLGRRGSGTEDAPLRPLTPYAESKVRVEDDVAAIADDSLLAGVPAQRNGFRLLAASARRHRAEQPGRPRGAHRRGSRALRRHAVAAAGARPRHRRGVSHCAGGADRTRCTAAPTTSAPNRTTSRSPRSREAVVDVVPGAKLLITGETGADPRSYRVDFSAFRDALGFEAAWSIPDGAAELYKRVHRRRA